MGEGVLNVLCVCVCVTATLRALYLSDNDFEVLPPDISKLSKLQIVSKANALLSRLSVPRLYVFLWRYRARTSQCIMPLFFCN